MFVSMTHIVLNSNIFFIFTSQPREFNVFATFYNKTNIDYKVIEYDKMMFVDYY